MFKRSVLVFASCFSLIISMSNAWSQNLQKITSFEATSLLKEDNVIFVDVRSAQERQTGEVAKKAVLLQFGPDQWVGEVSEEDQNRFVEQIISLTGNGKEIILICQRGVRSEAAQRALFKKNIRAQSIADGYLGNNEGPGWKSWI